MCLYISSPTAPGQFAEEGVLWVRAAAGPPRRMVDEGEEFLALVASSRPSATITTGRSAEFLLKGFSRGSTFHEGARSLPMRLCFNGGRRCRSPGPGAMSDHLRGIHLSPLPGRSGLELAEAEGDGFRSAGSKRSSWRALFSARRFCRISYRYDALESSMRDETRKETDWAESTHP